MASLSQGERIMALSYVEPIKTGQHGKVSIVNFTSQTNRKRILVEKSGDSGVNCEIKISKAIASCPGFPRRLVALPIYQESDEVSSTLYTCYRPNGDLQANSSYIQRQLKDSSALSYIFQGFDQLVKTLDALHNSTFKDEKGKSHQGIVHNDIKPDNIFIKENGDFELADFGCAYFKYEVAPQYATYLYSAPELWNESNFCKKAISDVDKADIWSLGATLMYLLTSELIAPSPEKSFSDIERFLGYQEWAKNYAAQWEKRLTEKRLNASSFISEFESTQDNNELNTAEKRTLLEKLALLMLAPVDRRPGARELRGIMDKFSPKVVVEEEAKNFSALLLQENTKVKVSDKVSIIPGNTIINTNGYVPNGCSSTTPNLSR